jgi:hypothetical protein
LVESIGQQAAIGQSGQLVVQCPMTQLVFDPAGLGHVGDHRQRVGSARLEQRTDVQTQRSSCPVGMRIAQLVLLCATLPAVEKPVDDEGRVIRVENR